MDSVNGSATCIDGACTRSKKEPGIKRYSSQSNLCFYMVSPWLYFIPLSFRVCPRNGSNCCKSREFQSRIRRPTLRRSSTLLDSTRTTRKESRTMQSGKSLLTPTWIQSWQNHPCLPLHLCPPRTLLPEWTVTFGRSKALHRHPVRCRRVP